MLSTELDELVVLRDNSVVRPNKGRSGMLIDEPNTKKLHKGKKKVEFDPISLSKLRRVWQAKRRSSLFKVGSMSCVGVEIVEMVCL